MCREIIPRRSNKSLYITIAIIIVIIYYPGSRRSEHAGARGSLIHGFFRMFSLDEYLRAFQNDFGRKDRFLWAKVYLKGLLGTPGRKTIEGIARWSVLPEDTRVEDTWQALQNFIQKSPWDEQRIMRQYRKQIVQLLGPDGVLVIDDVVVLKQGQHSVGVHRQFSPEQKKKVNCQLLTTVFMVANEHTVPLAFRLYLPRAWQENPERLAKSKVPQGSGAIVSKVHLALEMLESLHLEELPYKRIVAGESYARSEDFRAGLAARGTRLLSTDERNVEASSSEIFLRRFQTLSKHLKDHLGLDHYEGRTWRGLHHHLCLVALAHGYKLHRQMLGE
jgi:SRSO17 transposase